MQNSGHDIVCRARLCFAEAGLGILRLGEAAGCRHLLAERHRWAHHGVGSRYKTRLSSLWDKHQAANNITSREDMRRGSSQVLIDLHEFSLIEFDTRGSEVQPGTIGHPAHCHHYKRRLGTVPLAILREVHADSCRGLLERLDSAEILLNHHARFSECPRSRSRYVF